MDCPFLYDRMMCSIPDEGEPCEEGFKYANGDVGVCPYSDEELLGLLKRWLDWRSDKG